MAREMDVQATEVRDAAQRNDWQAVHALLTRADASQDAESLELLATASFLTGKRVEARISWERAYRARLQAGEELLAALAAARVGHLHLEEGAFNQGTAWISRGEQLVEGQPESAVHGWLAVLRSLTAFFRGDAATTREFGEAARDIGRRVRDAGVEALGINGIARALIMDGRLEEGLRMLDQVAVAAAAGDLDPVSAGYIFCSTVCASQTAGDYRRSEQWTAEMDRWSAASGMPYVPGRCRVHKAELLRLEGAWTRAEHEARTACDELRACGPVDIGWALAELGLIRLRMGDIDGAEAAFRESHERGRPALPGTALLHLARGEVERASRTINDALDDPPEWPSWEAPLNTKLGRALLLPVQVEVALAAGDVDRAESAAAELEELARLFPTTAMLAAASEAHGRVQIARGEGAAARRTLQSALREWAEVNAPYEMARVRMAIAEAHLAVGDKDASRTELNAAHAAFQRLGARLDARRAVERGADHREQDATAGVKRTFVFTDIVRSTDLAELIGDDAWHQLKRWHDDLIRSLVVEQGGEVVDSTGDGFFLAFPQARAALNAAIAIQRSLAEHRRTAGFAPKVRIGVQVADAVRDRSGYSGIGVHAAARIAASAGADEILAGMATIRAVGELVEHDDPQTLQLKGLSEPVPVASVRWR
jgi:class 3 adenylate cyclase